MRQSGAHLPPYLSRATPMPWQDSTGRGFQRAAAEPSALAEFVVYFTAIWRAGATTATSISTASVAQLVRASRCHAEGHGFKSRESYFLHFLPFFRGFWSIFRHLCVPSQVANHHLQQPAQRVGRAQDLENGGLQKSRVRIPSMVLFLLFCLFPESARAW